MIYNKYYIFVFRRCLHPFSFVRPEIFTFGNRFVSSGIQRGGVHQNFENIDANNFNKEWRNITKGSPKTGDLRGPRGRGRFFPSYKEDPGSFITNILIIIVTAYSIFTLTPGESMKVRRQRKLRQILLEKAELTEAELAFIENYDLGRFQNLEDSAKSDK